jgi:hypothetical protein
MVICWFMKFFLLCFEDLRASTPLKECYGVCFFLFGCLSFSFQTLRSVACERLRFEAVDCRLGSWSCVIVIIFLVWVSCLKENQWLWLQETYHYSRMMICLNLLL